jgi:hypothetical protein
LSCTSGGSPAFTCGSIFLTASTIASVDALPFLRIEMYVPRRPFSRTMFVCTPPPSRTCATSLTYTIAPFTCLIGRSPSWRTESVLAFSRT